MRQQQQQVIPVNQIHHDHDETIDVLISPKRQHLLHLIKEQPVWGGGVCDPKVSKKGYSVTVVNEKTNEWAMFTQ
jgi:hypothetical protein